VLHDSANAGDPPYHGMGRRLGESSAQEYPMLVGIREMSLVEFSPLKRAMSSIWNNGLENRSIRRPLLELGDSARLAAAGSQKPFCRRRGSSGCRQCAPALKAGMGNCTAQILCVDNIGVVSRGSHSNVDICGQPSERYCSVKRTSLVISRRCKRVPKECSVRLCRNERRLTGHRVRRGMSPWWT
jgi:hypothetical protein